MLESNGSAIPLFRKQIRKGGPVTLTDERIVRSFMLIPEACKVSAWGWVLYITVVDVYYANEKLMDTC